MAGRMEVGRAGEFPLLTRAECWTTLRHRGHPLKQPPPREARPRMESIYVLFTRQVPGVSATLTILELAKALQVTKAAVIKSPLHSRYPHGGNVSTFSICPIVVD